MLMISKNKIYLLKLLCIMPLFFFMQSCSQLNSTAISEVKELALPVELMTISQNYSQASVNVYSPDDIHNLNPEQIANFLEYMNAPKYMHIKKNKRLFNYLDSFTKKFEYSEITLTASQVLAERKGNCMSLAILTTALAKLVNLELDYQLMEDAPVYELRGNIVNKVVHVRTRIYDSDFVPDNDKFYLIRPGIVIDYFPTNRQRFLGNISEGEYLSMYYQNMSAEALAKNDMNGAFAYVVESLNHEPMNAHAINMLAVLNRRVGDIETSEKIYQFGIDFAQDKLSLLKNYRILLLAEGRAEEAELIEKKLNSITDQSPFSWYQLAQSAYQEGDFFKAIRYYNRAIEIAPYFHEAYLGIALSNYEEGRYGNAEAALNDAIEKARRVSVRNLYQAKLAVLSMEVY